MDSKHTDFLDSNYIRELKKQLENASNLSILEFNDCKQLSALLNEKGLAVSAHTFARLFGVLKENHRPYTSTLNLICEFLGYASYSLFCAEIRNNMEYALSAPNEVFHTGPYSFIALELAIINNDWENVTKILDDFNTSSPLKNELVMFLGNLVRNHPHQKEFLQQLTRSENGKWLFFESYVDEDDRNNYYSNALKYYYQNVSTKPGNQLFLNCFLASKAIYQQQSYPEFTFFYQDFDQLQGLHFHEISRLFELQILIDFEQNNLSKTLLVHLDKICSTCSSYLHYDACWILARSIKALAFAGMLKKAITYSPFRQLIFERFQSTQSKIESIGELIIQLVGHVLFVKEQRNELYFPPSKIEVKHDNETNARILIESATAQLYAPDSVKTILDKNIYSFAKNTGQTWVFDLLN
jgi:hypothetical protein